jgi:hypothetical protein
MLLGMQYDGGCTEQSCAWAAAGGNNIKTLLARLYAVPLNFMILLLPPAAARMPLCSVHPKHAYNTNIHCYRCKMCQ